MKKKELERIYQNLVDEGHIGYGRFISASVLSSYFGIDIDELWSFRLILRQYLEKYKGFYVKVENDGLKINDANHSGEIALKRDRQSDQKKLRTKKTLEKIDFKVMSPSARSEATLAKRILEMKLRSSRLIMREVEYYEVNE